MFKHAIIPTNGIALHVVEHGVGPALLLCHGFPETWRSWRNQIEALAAAGYRVIAPDMRGYGESSAPESAAVYTQLHIVGDLIGLLDALEVAQATIIGHDWGAVAAWNAAVMRPDRFPRVVSASVPYAPRGEVDLIEQLEGGREGFYMRKFVQPESDAMLAHDPERYLLNAYVSASGGVPDELRWRPFAQPKGSTGRRATTLLPRPDWLDADDFAHAVATFTRTGFRGGLNWYRAIERTFELTAPFKGARITQPALFLAGREDAILDVAARFVASLPQTVPGLSATILIDGAGHWVQQEAPGEVPRAILDFLAQHG